MSNIYIKEAELVHGVKLTDNGYDGDVKNIEPYTFNYRPNTAARLGVSSTEIMPASVGDVFKIHRKLSKRYNPGSGRYNDMAFYEHLYRLTPSLTKEDVEENMSAMDKSDLEIVLLNSQKPEGGHAFLRKNNQGYIKQAIVKDPMVSDEAQATSRGGVTEQDDFFTFRSWLIYVCTDFISKDREPDFEVALRATYQQSLMSLSWNDYQVLSSTLMGEDMKPLTEILGGSVMGDDGAAQPFRDMAKKKK